MPFNHSPTDLVPTVLDNVAASISPSVGVNSLSSSLVRSRVPRDCHLHRDTYGCALLCRTCAFYLLKQTVKIEIWRRICSGKRQCRREGLSAHASIANYQNEARSGLCAMRPWQELASDLGPTALGSMEPIGRSALTRITRSGAGLKTRPSCSSHNRRLSPRESIQDRAPFESSVHCT
jgi:hypothetical protein